MGWRFRKSFKILPGVRINFNKNSTGITFGRKGIHYTINSKGKQTASVGVPGTGLYYTKSTDRVKKRGRYSNADYTKSPQKKFSCLFIISCFIGCLIFAGAASDFGKKISENSVAETVMENQSITLSQYDSTNICVSIDEHDNLTFYLEPESLKAEDIEIVNSNESVALCLLQDVRSVPTGRIAIVSYRGLDEGTADLYIKIKDSNIQSDVINISVSQKSNDVDSSRAVYLNYNGTKYHYSSSCAGKSAYESTLNAALKLFKEPCSKCVH